MPTPAPHPTEVARAAVSGSGACQVCGRSIALRLDGLPKATHNRQITHNPDAASENQVTTSVECHGSRLPPVEYVLAFNAARAGS